MLHTGDEGYAVVLLQNGLHNCGYEPGKSDGLFSDQTRLALKRLQIYHGINPSGIYCENSEEVLKNEVKNNWRRR